MEEQSIAGSHLWLLVLDSFCRKIRKSCDHIRKRRLGLKLFQKDVAEQLGVEKTIEFLGCDPLPPASTLAEQLVRKRTSLGLSQEESAKRLGVDPSTLAKWERGERKPGGVFLGRVKRFLEDGDEAGARRAG